MLVEKITSRQNPLVKRFRRVRAGDEKHLIFLEGVRLMEEAVRAGVHFESIAYSPALESTDRGLALLDELRRVPCRGAHVSAQVMDAIADTRTTQGIVAVATRPVYEMRDLFGSAAPFIVVADQLQDPGNLGTIVRTAEAAGASGMVTTRDTVDPYSHKALRGSMGAALRLPIVAGIKRPDLLLELGARRIKLVASWAASEPPPGRLKDAARGDKVKRYTEADLTLPVALVVGREAKGVERQMAREADELIHIPMAPGVESLNVAAAAAVLLYEAARQRGFAFDGPDRAARKGLYPLR